MRSSSLIFALLVGLFSMRSAFADDIEDRRRPEQEVSRADETRFNALVKKGARAADEGRLNDVARAYMDALEIRRDPLIAGRLGVVLATMNDSTAQVLAAMNLYTAITEHAGISRAERKAFFEAFDLVQSKICRIYVTTNDVDAVVQIDNDRKNKSHGSFWQFFESGKHEIVGTLDGHDDVRTSIDCPKGKRIEVFLDFAHKDAPVKTVETVRDKLVFIDSLSPMSNADHPSEPVPGTNRGLHFAVGPAMVFGVAPVPAFGISLASTYTLGNVPGMLGARSAYAMGPIEGRKLDVFTFTGFAGPCVQTKWFNACGFASVNVIKPRTNALVPNDFDTLAQISPGLGLGVSGRYSLKKTIALFASGDATILPHNTAVYVPGTPEQLAIWNGSQFLASLSMGIEFAP